MNRIVQGCLALGALGGEVVALGNQLAEEGGLRRAAIRRGKTGPRPGRDGQIAADWFELTHGSRFPVSKRRVRPKMGQSRSYVPCTSQAPCHAATIC